MRPLPSSWIKGFEPPTKPTHTYEPAPPEAKDGTPGFHVGAAEPTAAAPARERKRYPETRRNRRVQRTPEQNRARNEKRRVAAGGLSDAERERRRQERAYQRAGADDHHIPHRHDATVVAFVARLGLARAGDIAKQFGVTRRAAQARLRVLVQRGRLKRVGWGRYAVNAPA